MNTRSPEQAHFGFLIYDVHRLLRSTMMQRISGEEMTEAQWRAIAHLNRMEGCRQIDLAQALQIKPITLARVIDRLEEAGLVTRRVHKQDRRALTLHLTKAARPVIQSLRSIGQVIQEEALQGLTDTDRATLIRLLESIRSNLSDDRPDEASGAPLT